jgi:hypothetical protein
MIDGLETGGAGIESSPDMFLISRVLDAFKHDRISISEG